MATKRPPTRRQLRNFGLTLPISALVLGLIVRWRFDSIVASRIIWVVGALVALSYALLPRVRRPIYSGMNAIGRPIELAISSVVVTLAFLLVITPVALVLRVFRHQPIDSIDPEQPTYWHDRQPESDVARYLKPF
jgi:phosphatidylserine synthase